MKITIDIEWNEEQVSVSSQEHDFAIDGGDQIGVLRAMNALDSTYAKARVALEGRLTPEFIGARSAKLFAAIQEEMKTLSERQLSHIERAYPGGFANLTLGALDKALAYVRKLNRDNRERSAGRP